MTEDRIVRDAEELTALAARTLEAVGATRAEAAVVAGSLIAADARGIHSHGLMRLPLYVEAVEQGGIVANAPMRWTTETGAIAKLDAASGFGQAAMDVAVGKA